MSGGIRAAFNEWFVGPGARMVPDKQSSYVLALHFGLLDEPVRQQAADRLADLVHAADDHLQTGFLTTPYLCDVLARHGHLDLAYRLLLQDTPPSWLYPVTQGATTMWETWDGVRLDGSRRKMSFNHYAFGAIGSWLYATVAGIAQQPGSAGYEHVLFEPRPGGSLTHAAAGYESVRGLVACGWSRDDGQLAVSVTVPPTSRATVRLPHARADDVLEGELPVGDAEGVAAALQCDGFVEVDVVSGSYEFSYPRRG